MEDSIEKGRMWLENLLDLMGVAATASVVPIEQPNGITADWLTIDINNLSLETKEILIGERGKHIDAMQYLANTILNFGATETTQRSFTIEIGDYRQERQRELYELVRDLARQVRETGESVEIKSLSSAERKQIHTLLENEADLTTESRGQEPDRRLIIKLKSGNGE